MSAPRVLVLGSVLAQPMGGVRRHNQELLPRAARWLRARGGSLAVLAGRDGVGFELGREIDVLESSIPARPALARARVESRATAAALRRAREQGRPFDVVHTAHLPAPRGLEAPFTLTLHDLKSVLSASEPRVRRWIGRFVIQDALRRAARVLVVSRALRDELLERFQLPPESLVVARNGADHLPLRPRAPRPNAPLLFVGHLEPRKNVRVLLRALELDPSLGELWLAGEGDAARRTELEREAAVRGVLGRVRFLGLQSDESLAQLYSACRCVALPSLREGFDIPLVEALRAGAPVACSDLPVHRELAGDSASYFEPESPASAVAALREACSRSAAPAPALSSWDEAAERCARAWVSAASRR